MNTFQALAEMFRYFKQRRDDKYAPPKDPLLRLPYHNITDERLKGGLLRTSSNNRPEPDRSPPEQVDFTPPPDADPIGFDEDINIPVKPFSSAPAPSPRNRLLVNREDILRRGDEIAAVREARRARREAEFDSYGSLLSSPRLEQQSPAYPDGDPDMYRAVVRDVLLGRYGNGQEREDNLIEAGLHPEVVRNMVNEQIRLGSPILDEFEDNTPVVSPPAQGDISTGQIEPEESVDVSTTQGDQFDQLFESSGLNTLPEKDKAAALKTLFNEISAENIYNQVMSELRKETIEGTKQVKKSNEEIASEILTGIWGNGEDRKKALAEAGYDPTEVQTIVNQMMHGQPTNEVEPPKDLPTPESTFKPEPTQIHRWRTVPVHKGFFPEFGREPTPDYSRKHLVHD